MNRIFAFKMQNCVQKVHERIFAVKQSPKCGIASRIQVFLPLKLFSSAFNIIYMVICFE